MHIHICIHIHTHVHLHAHVHVHIHIHMHIHIHILIHTHIHTQIPNTPPRRLARTRRAISSTRPRSMVSSRRVRSMTTSWSGTLDPSRLEIHQALMSYRCLRKKRLSSDIPIYSDMKKTTQNIGRNTYRYMYKHILKLALFCKHRYLLCHMMIYYNSRFFNILHYNMS